MVGLLLAELGGQCTKVIPQRDDLGRHAGAKQRDRLSRNGGPGRSRLIKEIALVFDDAISFEHAESDSAVGRLETRPLGHGANLWAFPHHPCSSARPAQGAQAANEASRGRVSSRCLAYAQI